MTDTKASPFSYEIIERLFQDSACLTYNPLESIPAWQYAKELQQ